MSVTDVLTIVVGVLLFAAVFVGAPLLLIWALNTLGIASADYGFWEWVASFLLIGLVGSSS